ncbi:LysR family transcriptional regulator [Vibrio sp. ZSDE26]|uniref:LysR family transcriptional regulator n=1 Tax=Vibrio amylolyticus TaxID=2847292 RepID=A0A9X1XHD0_9VIBR|nr:LysR family transcriptional regulator [Vibrio amylolyticus]MCK6262979.1 LysR family transcriptional regulator [Vibrio amylolyticus]
MRIFIRVTEVGNFSKTADEMSTSPSYISKQIAGLEKSLGTRLFQRTTRVLTLTEAGKSYLHHCQKIMEQLSAAESEMSELLGSPSGLLRVSMPSVLGNRASAMMCSAFLRRYPEIELDILVEDRFVDLIEEGFDICIRASADFPDSTLIYKHIGDLNIHLMASTGYLERHGHPEVASDLAEHPLISHRYAGSSTFDFEIGGKTESVKFERKVRVNSTAFVRHLVEQGEGVGFIPVSGQLDESVNLQSNLVTLLPDYQKGKITISMVYPERTYTPLKVHKFINFFEEWFQEYIGSW